MSSVLTRSPVPTEKLQNRLELAKYFARLGFTKGAEIGVHQGQYSEILCQTIPNLHLLSVDSYPGRRQRHLEAAKPRLEPLNVDFILKSSMEAVKDVPDESLDFVFIDACHIYEFVRDDIREWSKKVRPGGIVSGHDYYESRRGLIGVIRAVDEYVGDHGHELKLTDWDRGNPVRDERQPSWYFFNGALQSSQRDT